MEITGMTLEVWRGIIMFLGAGEIFIKSFRME
jgi:hypothetical protein